MSKHEPKNERKIVNNAIKYWEGFLDALEWARKNRSSRQDLKEKIDDTKILIKDYQDRLYYLMREDGKK